MGPICTNAVNSFLFNSFININPRFLLYNNFSLIGPMHVFSVWRVLFLAYLQLNPNILHGRLYVHQYISFTVLCAILSRCVLAFICCRHRFLQLKRKVEQTLSDIRHSICQRVFISVLKSSHRSTFPVHGKWSEVKITSEIHTLCYTFSVVMHEMRKVKSYDW